MNYKIMFKRYIPLLFVSALSSQAVLAEQSDFEKPIKVDSDQQFLDAKTKVSLLKGNVNIMQGSLVINADEVEIDASKGEGKEVFTAKGEPASYSQTLDDGKRLTATAETITYSIDTRMISLTGDAKVERDSSSVSGASIVYDMAKEQFLADSDEGSNSRVSTVFRPSTSKKDDKSNNKNNKKQEPPAP